MSQVLSSTLSVITPGLCLSKSRSDHLRVLDSTCDMHYIEGPEAVLGWQSCPKTLMHCSCTRCSALCALPHSTRRCLLGPAFLIEPRRMKKEHRLPFLYGATL